jgi:hypothetical protein
MTDVYFIMRTDVYFALDEVNDDNELFAGDNALNC